MHTPKTAMTTNKENPSVAARLAGVGDLEDAHAGKPDCYDAVFEPPLAVR
jgi:hypothetical protein